MSDQPTPPQAYSDFTGRFPGLARAWEAMHDAGRGGPIDERTVRLVKLGIAIGAQMEGPVHASVRKGIHQGIGRDEMEQVVALAAGTIGIPAAVAAFTWIRDILDES